MKRLTVLSFEPVFLIFLNQQQSWHVPWVTRELMVATIKKTPTSAEWHRTVPGAVGETAVEGILAQLVPGIAVDLAQGARPELAASRRRCVATLHAVLYLRAGAHNSCA